MINKDILNIAIRWFETKYATSDKKYIILAKMRYGKFRILKWVGTDRRNDVYQGWYNYDELDKNTASDLFPVSDEGENIEKWVPIEKVNERRKK